MTDDQINHLIHRNNHLLWLLMFFDINRYLMSNTHGRWDGSEKADRHANLCNTYLAGILFCAPDNVRMQDEPDGMEAHRIVHDATQDLTDHLDTVIGFPLEDPRPKLEFLAPLFFDEFLLLADEAILPFLIENGLT